MKAIICLFLIFLFISCRCIEKIKGYVIDNNISKPLDSVVIITAFKKTNYVFPNDSLEIAPRYYSDRKGQFIYKKSHCKHISDKLLSLIIYKEGYKMFSEPLEDYHKGDTIILQKIN